VKRSELLNRRKRYHCRKAAVDGVNLASKKRHCDVDPLKIKCSKTKNVIVWGLWAVMQSQAVG